MHGTTQSDPSQNKWKTPKGDNQLGKSGITLNMLIKEFDLKLDPAADKDNTMCKEFFTIKDNGLTKEWTKNTIYNPPYSEEILDETTGDPVLKMNKKKIGPQQPKYLSVLGAWVEHGVKQAMKHKIVVIGILPVYTSQAWFHQYVDGVAEIKFLFGRVHYEAPDGSSGSPNFDTMICIWDARE